MYEKTLDRYRRQWYELGEKLTVGRRADPLRPTDSFLVWDLSGEVKAYEHVALFGAVENLTNNAYIIDPGA